MRKTIYLSEETDIELISHIKELEKDKVNISGFFVNAAKYYLEHQKGNKKDLKDIVREIIEKEYKDVPQGLYESQNSIKSELANKLKGIYD